MISVSHLTLSYGEKRVLEDLSLTLPERGRHRPVRPLRLRQDYPTALSGRTGAPPGAAGSRPPPRGDRPALSGGPPVPLAHGGAAPDGCAPTGPLGGGPRWLDLAGLTGEEGSLPASLSGGMRRRLALVRALALGGRLYLLDEPFTGVDPARIRRLMEALRALDTPVLLSSHEALVCSLADRVICLDGPLLRLADGRS